MTVNRLKGLIGVMIALQLISMLTKFEEWALIRRIDETTQEHGVVLASHSGKLNAILDFGFSPEFAQKLKDKHGSNP